MKRLKRLDTPEGRCYIYMIDKKKSYEEGGFILMPSVTTILSLFESKKLQELEKSMGKEALEALGQKAARKGTCMHAFLENYFICIKNGGDGDRCLMYTQKKSPDELRNDGLLDESINPGRDLFYNYMHEGYLDRVNKVVFTEKFIWSIKHKFAGTADFGYLTDLMEVIIADFKSASGVRDEETLKKYEMQLAAYVIAFEEIYNQKVTRAEVWVSHPNGIQEVKLDGAQMEERKIQFIEMAEKYHSQWDPQNIVNKYYTVAS